ncbi:ABC-type sugar transport system, periplasmic component [Moorella thermoacetica Y72]|uniref:ABC-type sugar transport system, periplasmic component n=1 Tax=Moorella thermoacetica Y72 TaxID=1325331 RepID=A0A0S6UEF6_NEOTH|nr:ABC-type sugar transport system, periplasmic component [Moorella thermoacetica Y72]
MEEWIVLFKMTRKKMLIFTAVTLIGVSALLGGCGSKQGNTQTGTSSGTTTQNTEKSGEKVIGVSLLTREHVFYNLIEKAIQEKAQGYKFKPIIMDASQDSNKQLSQVQDFITQKVDAIVLAPTASAGIAPAVDLAKKAGIPVFTIDIKAEGDVKSHVATDNYAGGKLAAKYAAEKVLNGKGKVAIITYSEVQSCVDREKGFKDALAEYPNIKVVDVENCSGSAEKAANLTQDILLKFPDLDLIFAVGDPFAVGAVSTIKAAGRNVKVIGFDGNPEAIQEIKNHGLWVADVVQHPDQIGGKVIDIIADYFNGKSVPPQVLIPPTIVDASNAK